MTNVRDVAIALCLTFNSSNDPEMQHALNADVVERLSLVAHRVLRIKRTPVMANEILHAELPCTPEEIRWMAEQYLGTRDDENRRVPSSVEQMPFRIFVERLVDAVVYVAMNRGGALSAALDGADEAVPAHRSKK